MPNIPYVSDYLSTVDTTGMIDKMLYWFGYFLVILLIFGVLIFIYFIMSYKYKVTIFQRGGSGQKDNTHAITRIRKDRLKQVTSKGITKWKFLFSRDKIQPLEFKHIYPGRNIYLYQTGPHAYFPFNLKVDNPSASFEPVALDIDFWTGLELQQIAEDYKKPGFWSQYGSIAIMFGTIIFCLILVGVTVYYTYQHANGVTSALSGLTDTLKNFGTMPGIGPH